jgi:hypothetical protein
MCKIELMLLPVVLVTALVLESNMNYSCLEYWYKFNHHHHNITSWHGAYGVASRDTDRRAHGGGGLTAISAQRLPSFDFQLPKVGRSLGAERTPTFKYLGVRRMMR